MRNILSGAACALCLLTFVPAPALGQTTPAADQGNSVPAESDEEDKKAEERKAKAITLIDNAAINAELFDFTYSEPASPILPLVGVEADQITRVTSLRKFGLALVAGSEAAGTGPAIGIDASPYWLLSRGAVSLQDYQDFGPLERIFARTKVAAAASEGDASSGMPSSLVFSLSSKLLDSQDVLVAGNFGQCLKAEGYSAMVEQVLAAPDLLRIRDRTQAHTLREAAQKAKMAELRPAMDKIYETCAERLARRMARRPSLDVGGGYRLTGRPGKFRDFESSGAMVWATFSTGSIGADPDDDAARPMRRSLIGLQMQGVVHARYTFAERFYNSAGVETGKADSGLIVAALESTPSPDKSERFRWSLQAGWTKQDSPNGVDPDKEYWRYLGIGRFRVAEGIWLNGTFGQVSGKGVERDTYLTFGISFAPGAGGGIGALLDALGK